MSIWEAIGIGVVGGIAGALLAACTVAALVGIGWLAVRGWRAAQSGKRLPPRCPVLSPRLVIASSPSPFQVRCDLALGHRDKSHHSTVPVASIGRRADIAWTNEMVNREMFLDQVVKP